MKAKNKSAKIIKRIVIYFAKNSANCTTSGVMFQPKAPVLLKQFSKHKTVD